MNKGSTLFLKFVLSLMALAGLAMAGYVLPAGIWTDRTGLYRPILIGMYLPAIPFFMAVVQSFKLLSLIDKNQAFSNLSVKALRIIKYCAASFSGLFAVWLPFIFNAADKDDAPGIILIALVLIGASFVIAVFAAVLEKLLEQALTIKSENDLTV